MRLFLIGYRGTGKSTVGRLLADKLQSKFVDTDHWIESRAGMSIRQLFEQEGEAGFRDREEQVVAEAAALPGPIVVALGGGAILREANRQRIRQAGKCIWLRGRPEQLFVRIQGDASTAQRRPNLSSSGGYDEVVELLAVREPIYAELSQLTVSTDDQSPDEITREIAAWVNQSV